MGSIFMGQQADLHEERSDTRIRLSPHLSTRQYARIVEAWVTKFGLDADAYGTHTMHRTEPRRFNSLYGAAHAAQLSGSRDT
jgi:hypothetical protein